MYHCICTKPLFRRPYSMAFLWLGVCNRIGGPPRNVKSYVLRAILGAPYALFMGDPKEQYRAADHSSTLPSAATLVGGPRLRQDVRGVACRALGQ